MPKITVNVPNIKKDSGFEYCSFRPGIVWPAIPNAKGAQLLAVLHQLEQSQWWSPEKFRRAQFAQALNLLQHALKTVPYYKERLSFLDGVSELNETLWRKIPILTRQDLQRKEKQLISTSIPSSHGDISEIRTSGSTGRPVRVKRTENFLMFFHAFNLREHFWLGQDCRAKQMVIRSIKGLKPGQIKVQNSWGPPYNNVFNTGQSIIMEITTPIQEQLQNLIKYSPDCLLTYPSNLDALLHYGNEELVNNLRLRQVRTLSESVSDELRNEVLQKLGVKLVDVYSSHELGVMALQCPKYDHYHVQSENVIVEVLNDDGQPCKPGETGRVIVTSLHNFAMPLIRYSLLDYAEVGETCDCGRGLPVLKRIFGLLRNMVAMPDGSRIFPSVSAGAVAAADIAPIMQMQVIQHSIEDVEAKLVAERKLSKTEEENVQRVLQKALGFPFLIRFTYHDDIPRNPGGKFSSFISHVE